MSSVLFSRGINTQTGSKKKADEIARDLDSIKSQLAIAVSLATSNREVVAKSNAVIAELEAKITGLQGTVETLQAKVTALEERKGKHKAADS
jgi:chromosome segregation ATPase